MLAANARLPSPPSSQVEELPPTAVIPPPPEDIVRDRRNHRQRRPARRAAKRKHGASDQQRLPPEPTPVDCCLAVDTEIKEAYIKGKLASLVVDSGATSTCVKPMREQRLVSECGQYELKGAPMTYTGERSNKIFQMAMGSLAGAEDKTKLALNLNDEATEAHTVPGGLKNNLYSVNKLVQAGYGAVFDQDHFAVVDAEKVSRLTSRHAILKGFYSPDKKL